MWNFYTHTKKFFHNRATFSISLSPLNVLKFSFLSKLSDTLVNPWKALCLSITPNLFVVIQYLFWVLETLH